MVPFFWSGLLSFLVTFIKCKSLRIEKKRGSMWLVSVVNFKSFKVGLYESPTRCMFKSWVCRPIQIAYYILHVGREIKFCLCQCLVGNSVRSFVRSVGRSLAVFVAVKMHFIQTHEEWRKKVLTDSPLARNWKKGLKMQQRSCHHDPFRMMHAWAPLTTTYSSARTYCIIGTRGERTYVRT